MVFLRKFYTALSLILFFVFFLTTPSRMSFVAMGYIFSVKPVVCFIIFLIFFILFIIKQHINWVKAVILLLQLLFSLFNFIYFVFFIHHYNDAFLIFVCFYTVSVLFMVLSIIENSIKNPYPFLIFLFVFYAISILYIFYSYHSPDAWLNQRIELFVDHAA
jgi:hypothetical protein